MPSRVISAGSGTRRLTSVSVARSSQTEPAGGKLDTGKRLDRRARRGDTGDGLQLSEKRIAVERNLHDELLRRKVEVIGG